MKHLETSRNILNSAEVETWLVDNFVDKYQELASWITSTVRKWVLKNAPTKTAVVDPASLSTMPEWLRRAMTSDEPPENIEFTEEIRGRIQTVLDYMLDLVQNKPDTKIASIGFDIAEKRSEEWHKRLTRVTAPPPVEDGANIIKTYDNGYTWRFVVGVDALNSEGSRMGHCVGGYHQLIMRGHTSVFSLRDQNNDPHVTIEVNKDQSVNQIKGRANLAVVDKYLAYVVDFLKSRTWKSINFDGAQSIRDEMLEWLSFSAPAFYEHGGIRAARLPVNGYATNVRYLVSNAETRLRLGVFTMTDGGRKDSYHLRDIEELQDAGSVQFLINMYMHKDIRVPGTAEALNSLKTHCKWGNTTGNWHAPSNSAAKAFCKLVSGSQDAKLLMMGESIQGWAHPDQGIVFYNSVDNDVVRSELLTLNSALSVYRTSAYVADAELVIDTKMGEWLARQVAGKSVRVDTDSALVNSLLTALRQPDIASIKSAYLKVKTKTELSDSVFKALGFQTGGRAINALSLVLLASLPIKNSAPFREYIFSKPNTVNCLLEVLLTPDHLVTALKSYGLPDETVSSALDVFKNEYIRLLPSKEEFAALDLDSGVEAKIKRAMSQASAHKTDKQRSKAIWGQI